MIITIDGPVATGKSTVAKKLAEALNFLYFDTGAMYRCLTWEALRENININNETELKALLANFDLQIQQTGNTTQYLVKGIDVTDQIRGSEVTSHVSAISAIGEVRQRLVKLQQYLAGGFNTVFEGRDMGTVVFPNADYKFFLTGDPIVRAERRFAEMRAKFPESTQNLTLEKTLEDLEQRDHYDTTRKNSPLKQAADSILIDTTGLSADKVVMKMLSCIQGNCEK